MLESQIDHESHMRNLTSQAPPDRILAFTSGLLMLLCLVLGALGNLIIVTVILLRKEMRSNLINLFVTSLCLNDLLNLLLNQSMVAASYLAHRWVLGEMLCKLMPEVNMVLVCVSLWHHALIGLHRYIVVVHNSTYAQLHKGLYAGFLLAGTRLLGVALSLSLPLFNAGSWSRNAVYQEKMLRCIFERTQRLRIMGVVLISQLLPCLIVLVCFALIFVFVRRANTGSLLGERARMRRELRITKMFGAVFLLFLAGFLPYGCLRSLDTHNTLGPDAYVVVTLLYAIASCANPLIFGAMNRDIRLACAAFLPCMCGANSSGGGGGGSVGGSGGGNGGGRAAGGGRTGRTSCVTGECCSARGRDAVFATSAVDAATGAARPCGRRNRCPTSESSTAEPGGQESRQQLLSVCSDQDQSLQLDSGGSSSVVE